MPDLGANLRLPLKSTFGQEGNMDAYMLPRRCIFMASHDIFTGSDWRYQQVCVRGAPEWGLVYSHKTNEVTGIHWNAIWCNIPHFASSRKPEQLWAKHMAGCDVGTECIPLYSVPHHSAAISILEQVWFVYTAPSLDSINLWLEGHYFFSISTIKFVVQTINQDERHAPQHSILIYCIMNFSLD